MSKGKTFNMKEYMKEYNSRPEVKERNKQWFRDHPDRVKEYGRRRNHGYFKYKNKHIYLKQINRTGVCSNCGAVAGVTCKQTQLHHFGEYDDLDPLKNTIELCAQCHGKETWKSNKTRNKK